MERAAIYCRISRDAEGLRAGVDRQEEDCRILAERLGFDVGHIYVDNDIGASTLSKRSRPAFNEMVRAARDREFTRLLAYSNSRLTRRPREFEDLLDLNGAAGLTIHTVVSGSADLSTADGRAVARTIAAWDAAEAERTGERIARAHLQRAQRGSVNHGARPFGWQGDKVTLEPSEAALIRQAVDDVLDGVGLREIVRRWNGAQVKTARGNEWDHRGLRQLLRGPRLAGWRVHQGRVATDAHGTPVRGVWEPLISPETHERVKAALSGRSGGSGARRGARKYLLSGLARCGRCGSRMYGTTTPTGHAYTCRAMEHTVSIAGPPTDEAVTEVILARLRLESFEPPPLDLAPFAQEDRIEAIPAKIGELMDAYNAGTLSASIAFGQVAKLEEEQRALAAERETRAAESIALGPADVDPQNFVGLDIDRQRSVTERLLEAVVIAPTIRGARWTADRITYAWRGVSS